MRPLPIRPLAAIPAFVLGMSVIRGAPVPIVDVAKLLGAHDPSPPQRVITLNVGDRHIGLVVAHVIGVRNLPQRSFDEVPRLVGAMADGVVAAVVALDAELLLMLEGARIVPEHLWPKIDALVASPE